MIFTYFEKLLLLEHQKYIVTSIDFIFLQIIYTFLKKMKETCICSQEVSQELFKRLMLWRTLLIIICSLTNKRNQWTTLKLDISSEKKRTKGTKEITDLRREIRRSLIWCWWHVLLDSNTTFINNFWLTTI